MSTLKTATTTVFCLALMGVVFSPMANASEWNRKTTMTFSGPVEIPGVHLKGWGGIAGRHLRVQNHGLGFRPPHRPDLQRGRNADLRHHPGDSELSSSGRPTRP